MNRFFTPSTNPSIQPPPNSIPAFLLPWLISAAFPHLPFPPSIHPLIPPSLPPFLHHSPQWSIPLPQTVPASLCPLIHLSPPSTCPSTQPTHQSIQPSISTTIRRSMRNSALYPFLLVMCWVPGAAHMSRIHSPTWGSSTCPTTMDGKFCRNRSDGRTPPSDGQSYRPCVICTATPLGIAKKARYSLCNSKRSVPSHKRDVWSSCLHFSFSIINNNYSPKWRWIAVDGYLATLER